MNVRFWRPGELAAAPMTFGDTLHVLDGRGARPEQVPPACGLVLVGSEAARGSWAGMAGDVPIAVVPPAGARVPPGEVVRAVHVVVGAAPGGAAAAAAEAAAAWARRAGVECGIEGAATTAGLRLAARLGTAPAAAPGSVVLDLRAEWERLEPTALEAAGVPTLTRVCELEGLTPARYRALAGRTTPGQALEAALATAQAALAERMARWAEGTGPHVLVITGEAENLVDVRVHQPFAALQRAGAIAGYTILRDGRFVFSSVGAGGEPDDRRRFGAVWVQRSAEPSVLLLLRALRCGFVYDLDDLLTVSPCYRPPFSTESRETVAAFVAAATAVSCGTAALALRLRVGARAMVTPNLAAGPPVAVAGAARAVVWASSDRPALAGSRRRVERAVRDFCRAHRLPLLCLGARAPDVFRGIEVEATGLLPHAAYLARLRAAAPGILVGPLETSADPATQDFVDSKSDVKVIEARLAGLVGVFSRAAPYVTSDLAPDVLCDNSYEGWLAGLERARVLCGQERTPPAWPSWRDMDATGLAPWAAAIRAGAADLSVGDVRDALAYVREQAATPIAGPERFDEADYLGRHPDVAAAVRTGVLASGYRHYLEHGFQEGRAARALAEPGAAEAAWWARLLRAEARLEREVAVRDEAVAALQARAMLDAGIPPPPPAELGTVKLPCPVCGAAGPHPVVLRQPGQVLARCGRCGACAATERVAHEYGTDPQSEVLLQLYLEQNAGIHQQTGLLFASPAQGSLLDVGCGFGFAVDLARRVLGWRAVGVDPSFQAASGRRVLGADIRHAMLTADMALGERFAVVTASEVIEHLPEPHEFLALLRARVAPGGALVLTTPDADALTPEIGPARRLAITAPRVHLVLFGEAALRLALVRAGFAQARVSRIGDGLVAVASDAAVEAPADSALRHVAAYQQYLETLVDEAAAGSALWNGAAGRLLALLEPTAPAPVLQLLLGRIGAAWRERFGFELDPLGLPEPRPGESPAELAARQPLNLGPVLLRMAAIAGPRERLALARAAWRIAEHAGRVLQGANMIDHDLRQTAWRARGMVADALAVLAPEMASALTAPSDAEWPGDVAGDLQHAERQNKA